MQTFSYGFGDDFRRNNSVAVQDMAVAHSQMRMDDHSLALQRAQVERSVADEMHGLSRGQPFLNGWEHAMDEIAREQDDGRDSAALLSVVDSPGQAIGVAINRMLTYETNRVIEPRELPYDALRLFGTDSSIPEGYTSWTAKREEYYSSWEYAKGNPNTLPTSGFDQFEEMYHMVPAVHAIRLNHHELKSAQVMRVALRQKLNKIAERGRKEFLNARAWNNDQPGMSDILSYAWVPRIYATANFGDGSLSEDAEVQQIAAAARYSRNKTQNTYGPTRAIMARDLADYLEETYRSDQLDTTQMESLKKIMSGISTIEVVDDLVGAGPNGESIVLFDRPGSISHKLPVPLSRLPVQRQGFDMVFYMYLVHGGVHIEHPMDATLFYVNVNA